MSLRQRLLFVVQKSEALVLGLCLISLISGATGVIMHQLNTKLPLQLIAMTEADMVPHHSLVILKNLKGEVKNGQLISFIVPGSAQHQLVRRVERVINDNGMRFIITKADANPGVDTWLLTESQIKGTYSGHIPLLGYWLNFLLTPVGTGLGIVAPALIIIGLEFKRLLKDIGNLASRNMAPTSV